MDQSYFNAKTVELFKANGPFFFSLFLAGLWVWTIKESRKLLDKPRSNRMTLFLLGSSAVCLLGSLVVGWRAVDTWTRAQDLPYGRYASVLGVPNDIAILADAELYQKREEISQSPSHSVRLAFFLKNKCSEKDHLLLQFNRLGMNKPDVFPVPCSLLTENWQEGTSFLFDVDEKSGNLILRQSTSDKPAAKGGKELGLLVVPSALAADGRLAMNVPSQTVRDYSGMQLTGLQAVSEAARTLQSDRAPPGEKLEALGRLAASPLAKQHLASDAVNKDLAEPLYSTLFDLTRHSDKQLAIKTRLFLEEAPIAQDIASLAARAPATQETLDHIFDSMTAQDIDRLATSMKTAGYPTDVVAAAQAKRAAKNRTMPIPTYTIDGDRFYVRAKWDNQDEKTTQCVGKAYADLWGGTLKQQTELAKARPSRVVYYKKDWAADMFRRLEACDAKASYVPWEPAGTPPASGR
jgi:hypothetical protein